jgi:hypothetical protein
MPGRDDVAIDAYAIYDPDLAEMAKGRSFDPSKLTNGLWMVKVRLKRAESIGFEWELLEKWDLDGNVPAYRYAVTLRKEYRELPWLPNVLVTWRALEEDVRHLFPEYEKMPDDVFWLDKIQDLL